MKVYIVMTSNCEPYEDYHEGIESIHTTYEGAVKHIENMRKPSCKGEYDNDFFGEDPYYEIEKPFVLEGNGRWVSEYGEYADAAGEEPLYTFKEDAWIVGREVEE